jgi:probable HAF family extracellular repeat protein
MIDLGTLGGTQSIALAVNASGQVVGQSTTAGDTEQHAFSWTQSGGMIDLGTLGGAFSVAWAVNASGQVAGDSTTGSGEFHAVLWKATVATPSPVKVWVGLKNSDDVGIRFDLQARVYLNGSLVGSGTLNSVAGGSSGFNNAKLNTIPLTLTAPVSSGENLRVEVLVRNACSRSGKNSGSARLWYNGQPIDGGATRDAGSRFHATIDIDQPSQDYFLREGSTLSTTAGTSRLFVNTAAGAKCSPFASFGSWSTTVP